MLNSRYRLAALPVLMLMIQSCGGGSGSEEPDTGTGGGSGGGQTQKYLVTTSVTSGGSISPTQLEVVSGQTGSFTVTVNDGYKIDNLSGCAGSLSGNTYTTGAITANCQVSAVFELKTYTISTTVVGNGTIAPDGLTIAHGDHATFKLTPDIGYELTSASGCGGDISEDNFVTGPITSDCAISVTFTEQGSGVVVGRYIDNKDGTITDTETNLMWLRCAYGMTWQDGTCTGEPIVMTGTGANLVDYNDENYDDWRMPTIPELRSLVYCSSGDPSYWLGSDNLTYYPATGSIICRGDFTVPTIIETAFPNTPTNTFGFAAKSSSPHYDYVGFRDGRVAQFTGNLNVRFVRDIR
ncbi:DUF1566 domain-containing protein [Rheinheimera sp. FR7-31]|uniref:DUF1566 domain-containing protein n=1 Tax=Rheinheimera fenheensis TaxID=3152295 RepID=UPI00325C7384